MTTRSRTTRLHLLRAVTTALALSALGATCDTFIPLEASTVLGRLKDEKALVGAYDLGQSCDLQMSTAERPPERDADWRPIPRNELFRRELTIEERRPITRRENAKDVVYGLLRVSEKGGKRYWARNTPAATAEAAQAKWRCLVGVSEATAAAPKLTAKVVALSTRAWECLDVSPIFGGRHDVTLEPYAVSQRTLVVGPNGKAYVAVRLERESSDQALTIPAPVLDRCFVAADAREAGPDAFELEKWLAGVSPDTTPPPAVGEKTVSEASGVDVSTCAAWGPDAMPTHACRVPIVRFVTLPEPGPFGPPRVRLLRERRVDALYVRGGKLVAPVDAPAVNMVVRARGATSPGLTRALASELAKNDPERIRRRLLSGVRLLRAGDGGRAFAPTHALDVEVAYAIPPVETTTGTYAHTYAAGKRAATNPKRAEAEAALFDARAAAESANTEVVMAERVSADAAAVCGNGEAANPTCGGAQWAWAASAIASRKSALGRVKQAEADLAATPASIDVADNRVAELTTKVLRRRGDAVVHVTITSEGKSARVELDTTAALSFDVQDAELPNDDEKKLKAKPARAPTADDVDKRVAALLVARIEELLMKWDGQRAATAASTEPDGDVGDLTPGSRSWLTAVARQATNGRDVKLLGDLAERGIELGDVAGKAKVFDVVLDDDVRKACFTFAASASANAPPDVNLTLAKRSGASLWPIATDTRTAPDAAVEACALPAGAYALVVSAGASTSEAPRWRELVVSMFESTPGRVTRAETVAASRGLPRVANGATGEAYRFTGSGVVRVAADGATAAVSPIGDRDGDGIHDELDQCPEAAETRNGHQDDDGCPDDAPAPAPSASARAAPKPAPPKAPPPPPTPPKPGAPSAPAPVDVGEL